MRYFYYVPDFGQTKKTPIVYYNKHLTHLFSNNLIHIAEKIVEDNFGNWDYPSSVEIFICRESGGKPELPYEKFEVTVEAIPRFSARKVN